MNATFVVLGARARPRRVCSSRRLLPRRSVVALLTVAGVSSALVGLAPLDTDGGLHTLVATPLFVAQPLALLGARRRVAAVTGAWAVGAPRSPALSRPSARSGSASPW